MTPVSIEPEDEQNLMQVRMCCKWRVLNVVKPLCNGRWGALIEISHYDSCNIINFVGWRLASTGCLTRYQGTVVLDYLLKPLKWMNDFKNLLTNNILCHDIIIGHSLLIGIMTIGIWRSDSSRHAWSHILSSVKYQAMESSVSSNNYHTANS